MPGCRGHIQIEQVNLMLLGAICAVASETDARVRPQKKQQPKGNTRTEPKTRAARAPPVWHQSTSTDSPRPEALQNLGLGYLDEQRPRQTKYRTPAATRHRFYRDLVTP